MKMPEFAKSRGGTEVIPPRGYSARDFAIQRFHLPDLVARVSRTCDIFFFVVAACSCKSLVLSNVFPDQAADIIVSLS